MKIKTRMPTWFRQTLYSLYALAWCSGISFFVLKTWFIIEGEFGPVKHFLQYPSLQVHGAAAFLMMLTFGFIIGAHIQYTWNSKLRKKRGIAIITLTALLMITAYLLYYIAEDTFREIIEYVHLAIGFVLPIALFAHVWKIQRASQPKANRKNFGR